MKKLLEQIRMWIIFVMFAVFLSGVTAFPLQTELQWLSVHSQSFPAFFREWIIRVYEGVSWANEKYPFLSYGTDWLAFAHLVIAMVFIGPYRDPVRNVWVIEWAMLCCVLVFPLALIGGYVRDIPFFHQLIDCSFGFFGIIPLIIIRKKIKRLEKMNSH